MICQNCGATISDGTVFCEHCGAQVSAAAPQQPAYQQPAYQQPVYQQPQQPVYQQPVYQQPQQPVYQQPAYGAPLKTPGKGFGVTALVLGIFCVIWGFIAIIGAFNLSAGAEYGRRLYGWEEVVSAHITGTLIYGGIPAVLAVIFGYNSKKRGYVNGVSKSGFVMGIIGLALALVTVIIDAGCM